MLSIEEKVFIIQNFYGGSSYRTVRDLFCVKFNESPIPSISTIRALILKFEKTGCVISEHCRRRPNIPDNNNEEMVIGLISDNPRLSTRSLSSESGISHTTVRKILKKHRYRPFKYQCHQELLPFDEEARQTFCETIQDFSNRNRLFLSSICFTDECTFTLNNEPNVQNDRYWAEDNPHLILNTRTQYPQKINIWAGILNSHIIGPFEIEGNLNSENYLDLLMMQVGPAIEDVARPNQEIWFQHDGCPAHFGIAVREFLNNSFQNRWIGRGGEINWPARSPDLTPCDFFLWGHLKNQVYKTRHPNINSLRNAIFAECRRINNRQLASVKTSFYNRLGYCLMQNGGLFEHLI